MQAQEKIGVIYVVHGGMDVNTDQHMWDATVQQFSYDHNHSVYNLIIWNRFFWPLVLDTETTDFAVRFIRKYDFSYARIGGIDPYHSITAQQLEDLKTELDKNEYGLKFEVEWAGWQSCWPAMFWLLRSMNCNHITYGNLLR